MAESVFVSIEINLNTNEKILGNFPHSCLASLISNTLNANKVCLKDVNSIRVFVENKRNKFSSLVEYQSNIEHWLKVGIKLFDLPELKEGMSIVDYYKKGIYLYPKNNIWEEYLKITWFRTPVSSIKFVNMFCKSDELWDVWTRYLYAYIYSNKDIIGSYSFLRYYGNFFNDIFAISRIMKTKSSRPTKKLSSQLLRADWNALGYAVLSIANRFEDRLLDEGIQSSRYFEVNKKAFKFDEIDLIMRKPTIRNVIKFNKKYASCHNKVKSNLNTTWTW